MFYTSSAEIQINDFCQDQVKPILNELKVYLEFFRNLFQRDIKEMKDVFESTENKILNAELEKVKKKSFEIQEGLQARIKILEKDVQRCQKQSVDFQLKLQHEKENKMGDSTLKNKNTNPLDYSWISRMEKLENENVSLEFKVQSLIKERDNVKIEYQKLFDSIKKTRSQTQKEMDELIVHVSEKTYAYGAIRAENQNLLSTISELKTRLEKVEKDNTSANVISNKENVIDVDVANASKAKTLLCVSCMQNVLIPCHDKWGDILLVQVYVDGIIFGSTNLDFLKCFATLMKNNFEMSMMGKLKFFLGLQVHQSPPGIFISQSQYAIELLKKHGLDECVLMSTHMATERLDANLQGTPADQTTYRRMIGGLVYLTTSHPDIAFATFVYDGKITSGGFQFLGGKLVSWSSKKQDCTAMSTAEAKYVSLSACCAQVIWMRTQLLDYGYKYNRILMYCDSKSAIAISCNPVQHSKKKYIDIWYHFIKEHVEKGTVELYFVGTEYQLADLFTKALPKERFEYLVHRIVIIMAQQQHAADVHPDELCPTPNKRYDSRFKQRRSTRLTPPAPVPTINKADEMILQDTLQIKKMVEGSENVIDDSLLPRNDESKIPGTRLEPRSDKESPEVEITNDEEVEITNVVILVNVNEEEEEITDEVYELKRREKGKIVEESMSTPFPTPIRSPRIHTNLVSLDTEKLQELTQGFYQGSHLILLLSMKADPQLQQQDIAIWLALQMKFESLQRGRIEQSAKTSEYESNFVLESHRLRWIESYELMIDLQSISDPESINF
ncbi:retrovirus-related pol polyprotein from transposon TNT 1-94 [Tanacetum coccineum]